MNRTTPPAWRLVLPGVLAALLLYVIVPALALGGEWGLVNYDDPYLVARQNPAIGKGLFGGLGDLLMPPDGRPFMDAWLPLYYWSLGLDHALFGDWWFGWHLHSGVLHACGAALVALIARALGMRPVAAVTASVVFALHPAATESVAWIASRKDQLAFAWSAIAALCYLRGLASGDRRLHVVGAVCLFVALTAKGTALALPLFLAVHAFLLRSGGSPVARLRPLIPYGVVAAIMAVVHVGFSRVSGAGEADTGAGPGALLYANLEVVWLYARTLVLPWTGWLSVEHGVDPFSVPASRAALGTAVLVAWLVATVVAWRRQRAVAAVLLAVPLALAPFNNLFPRTSVLFAERYLHMALLPFSLGVAGLLTTRFGRIAPFAAAAVLGVLAAPRIGVWRDSVSLWENAVETAGESVFVRMQLADAYAERGRSDPTHAGEWNRRAESSWRAARSGALARAEESAGARLTAIRGVQASTGLATHLLVTAGDGVDPRARVEEAVAIFDAAEQELSGLRGAVGADERAYLLLSNRAAAHQALGNLDQAVDDWRDAALRRPDDPVALLGLARAQLASGRAADVVETLERSREVAPDDPDAARERADLLLALGQAGAAKAELARALEAHPDDLVLLLSAGRLDLLLMRPLDAEQRFRAALEIRSDDEAVRTGLASALVQQAQAYASRDDVEGAREAARKAAEIAPDSSAPDQILGIVARRKGDLDAAAEHLRKAYARQPDGPRIREALASVLVERAAQFLAAEREGLAFRLLEEAVSVHPDRIATPDGRIEDGVAAWPALTAEPGGTELIARQAALRGLAWLAAGEPERAGPELEVAAVATRSGDPALRRVVLELLARARLGVGDGPGATVAVEGVPELAERLDDLELADALETSVAVWTEYGIQARGRAAADEAAAAFARARELLAAAEQAGLPRARVLLREGEILFAEELFLEATRAFDQSIELAPGDPDAYLDRAAVWRSHFLIEEDPSFLRGAEDDLRQALAIAPSDARVTAALGEVLLLRRKPSEAFPWLQRAVLADPSQLGARALLADLLVRAGRSNVEAYAESRLDADLEEAAAAAQRALALDAPSPGALLLEAEVLRVRGRWADALASLRRADERWPENAEVRGALAAYYRDLGHGYLLKRQTDAAVEAFRHALEVEGASIDLDGVRERLLGVAVAAFREGLDARANGRADEAEALFRRSLRADATPEGWFQLAMALSEKDELEPLDEAAAAYGEALALREEFQAARLNRAGVLMRLGRPAEAAEEYREWLRRAPEDDANRRPVELQIELADRLEREIAEDLERGR